MNNEIKKRNFKRISENRAEKILSVLNQLENLTNSSFYEYTHEEILELFNNIENKVKTTKEKLLKETKEK